MKHLHPLCLLLVAATSSLTATAEQPSSFRYHKEVDHAVAAKGRIVRLALDAEVYAVTRDDLADLRLFDDKLRETPYMIESDDDAAVEYPIVEFAVEKDLPEKSTIVEIHTRREPLTGFQLETSSENFQRKASLQAFDESGSWSKWKELAEKTISVVRLDDVDSEQLSFTFGESRYTRYRIVILNEDNRPLEIDGVKAAGGSRHLVFLTSFGVTQRLYYGSETAQPPSYETAAVLGVSRLKNEYLEATLGPQVVSPDYEAPPGPTLGEMLNNRVVLALAVGLMIVVLTWLLWTAGRRIGAIEEASPSS